jgi:hypothetical protein
VCDPVCAVPSKRRPRLADWSWPLRVLIIAADSVSSSTRSGRLVCACAAELICWRDGTSRINSTLCLAATTTPCANARQSVFWVGSVRRKPARRSRAVRDAENAWYQTSAFLSTPPEPRGLDAPTRRVSACGLDVAPLTPSMTTWTLGGQNWALAYATRSEGRRQAQAIFPRTRHSTARKRVRLCN